MSGAAVEYLWIDSNAALRELCERCMDLDAIALDTEFIRQKTFFPIASLIQLNDGERNYLIDPLEIDDWEAFAALLCAPQVTKLLHSCSEDMEVFRSLLGVLPQPLIDTQMAAGFFNIGFSMSYQRLCAELLGVEVEKGETRSNWLQRPLTESQKHYAALDVEYLIPMLTTMQNRYGDSERWQWLQQDCDALVDSYRFDDGGVGYYLKVKSAWKLDRKQLAVLQALCLWREEKVRKRDIPRGFLIKDRGLFELARVQPANRQGMQGLEDVPPPFVRRYGETVLDLIESVLGEDGNDHPARLPGPLSRRDGDRLKDLKLLAAKRAEDLGIPVEILIRKRDFEQLIRSSRAGSNAPSLPESLRGWRKQVIGNYLIEALTA